MKRVVLAFDQHRPFHDRSAEELRLKFISDFKPHIYVEGGDYLDWYSLSSFDRDPKRRFQLPDDLKEARCGLDKTRQALGQSCEERWFLGGNHEDRLRKYLWGKAPELSDLPGNDIQGLLELEQKGWGYIPYFAAVEECGAPGLDLYGVLVLHGLFARRSSAATAKAHFDRFHCDGVNGHAHRLGAYYFRAYGGTWKWLEGGCLCGLEPPWTPSPDWQQGLIAGYIFDCQDNPHPRFDLHEAVIHNKKLVFDGHAWKA